MGHRTRSLSLVAPCSTVFVPVTRRSTISLGSAICFIFSPVTSRDNDPEKLAQQPDARLGEKPVFGWGTRDRPRVATHYSHIVFCFPMLPPSTSLALSDYGYEVSAGTTIFNDGTVVTIDVIKTYHQQRPRLCTGSKRRVTLPFLRDRAYHIKCVEHDQRDVGSTYAPLTISSLACRGAQRVLLGRLQGCFRGHRSVVLPHDRHHRGLARKVGELTERAHRTPCQ